MSATTHGESAQLTPDVCMPETNDESPHLTPDTPMSDTRTPAPPRGTSPRPNASSSRVVKCYSDDKVSEAPQQVASGKEREP